MSCLVNFFVLAPLDEWLEVMSDPCAHNFIRMQNAIPEKYHEMFRALLIKFRFVELIIDNRDRNHFMEVNDFAVQYENEGVQFDCRYCRDSLLEIIRKTFYKTLFALQNDFCWDKYNRYCVVLSEDILFEEMEQTVPEAVPHRLAA